MRSARCCHGRRRSVICKKRFQEVPPVCWFRNRQAGDFFRGSQYWCCLAEITVKNVPDAAGRAASYRRISAAVHQDRGKPDYGVVRIKRV